MNFKFPNTPKEFEKFIISNQSITIDEEIISLLISDRKVVEEAINSDTPVYGLNTGLGANLSYRIKADEIQDFQKTLIEGRAVGTGKPFSESISKGILLSRIISASKGQSGISIPTYKYLINFWNNDLASVVPEIGSIGAGDLTQNAHFALGLMGLSDIWMKGVNVSGPLALKQKELPPLKLAPKDALALINHKGVSLSVSALALAKARNLYLSQEIVINASLEGFQANISIFSEAINSDRFESGQTLVAQEFRNRLKGGVINHRRVQDALSFRTIAPVLGVLKQAINRADLLWIEDLNSSADNPAVINNELISTPNFHSIALSFQLEAVSLAVSAVASASVQRIQRMMSPDLSGLPKYLSPIGGGSAGMVPIQKTAGALLGRVRHAATPIAFDPSPVSDSIEDLAPMTSEVAKKLLNQLDDFRLIIAIEGMVAAQAVDLRDDLVCSDSTKTFLNKLRKKVPKLTEDRGLGPDINKTALILDQLSQS